MMQAVVQLWCSAAKPQGGGGLGADLPNGRRHVRLVPATHSACLQGRCGHGVVAPSKQSGAGW